MLNRSTPRSVRNNNPGNLRDFGIKWDGLIGRDAHGYAIFATPVKGARAMYIDLRTGFQRDGENTVREIITEWAPPSDNNPTDRYIEFLSRFLGVEPDQVLRLEDARIPLMQGIAQFEAGFQPYTRELYELAILEAGDVL